MDFMNNNSISLKTKEQILGLAHDAILAYLKGSIFKPETNVFDDVLFQPRGNFVTLKVNGELHGCIGKIESKDPLYRDIMDNAEAAAFFDTRFPPISQSDLLDLAIEVSLLTKPERLFYKNSHILLDILRHDKPGVILKKGIYKATFLPQVWEEIPDEKMFLEELSCKAGLDKNDWQFSDIYIYSDIIIS